MLDTKKYGSAPVVGQEAEPDGIGKLERSSNTADRTQEQAQAAADLAAARVHLEKRAETNRIIASWRN
jgi:hypothetical protein